MSTTRRWAALVAAATLTLTAAACSGKDDQAATDATTTGTTTEATSEATAGVTAEAPEEPAAPSLLAACGERVDVQLDWWPQADYGFLFQLIGSGGDVDPDTFSYSGEIGDTGVTLSVHSGGSAVGFQSSTSLLYKDDSILLAVTSTEQDAENAVEFPTVAVFTPLQKVPLVFYWGNEDWDFQSLEDIRDAGVTVITVESAPYLAVLLQRGLLSEDQIDKSYQGTPARFVQEDGNVVQQGYLTSEVYQYQYELPEWNKPVKYVLVGDEYPALYHQFSIRKDRLEANRECLSLLVPLFQQAGIDYANDPSDGNAALVETAAGFTGSGWELSPELLAWAAPTLVQDGFIANGEDGAYGSLPLQRFNDFLPELREALAASGIEISADLTAEDFATNEFIDPDLHL
ncbi:MAG: hypothetical protein LBR19_09860 [Bifidobacteriaceae bacterium]|jgi:hypothetical protein|nr:hypothetical protein [Bifidobacteriaceae bacterium]